MVSVGCLFAEGICYVRLDLRNREIVSWCSILDGEDDRDEYASGAVIHQERRVTLGVSVLHHVASSYDHNIMLGADGMEVMVQQYNGEPFSATVPPKVTCTVSEAEPYFKGQSATPTWVIWYMVLEAPRDEVLASLDKFDQ
jgi:hypothetical protein